MERPGSVTRSKRQTETMPPPLQVSVTHTGVVKLNKQKLPPPPCTDSFKGQLEWKRQYAEVPMTSTPVGKQKKPKTKSAHIPNDVDIMDIELSFVSPIQKPERRGRGRGVLVQLKDQNQEPSLSEDPKVPGSKTKTAQLHTVEENRIHNVDVTLGDPIHNFDELLYKYGEDRKENGGDLHVHFERSKAKTYKPVTHKEVPLVVQFAEFKDREGEGAVPKNGEKRIRKKAPAKGVKSNSRGQVKKGKKLNPDAVDWIKKTNAEFADVMNFDLCVEKQEKQ